MTGNSSIERQFLQQMVKCCCFLQIPKMVLIEIIIITIADKNNSLLWQVNCNGIITVCGRKVDTVTGKRTAIQRKAFRKSFCCLDNFDFRKVWIFDTDMFVGKWNFFSALAGELQWNHHCVRTEGGYSHRKKNRNPKKGVQKKFLLP